MTAFRQIPCLCAATLLLSHASAWAQDTDQAKKPTNDPDKTVQQQIPPRITHTNQDNIIMLDVENDMFGGGTDNNYTSGVRASYMDTNAAMPEALHDFAEVMPGFEINDTTSLTYSIGQNIYTPEDIESRVQDPDDRPWAAFLYGSAGMTTTTNDHTDEVEVTLGVVGPAALGEQAQKAIHRHFSDSPMPKGWSNQLDNEPALMVGWQREYPRFVSGDIGPLFWSMSPHFGATVGNVYTYANTGISARIGPASEKWQDEPIRVRPSMPGSGFFEYPEDTWSWYVFGGIEGRAVARNIFLDGNTFGDSHSVDKNILVGDANAGVAFTYGKTRLSYTAVYRTKEFDTQAEPSLFGAVNLGYRW